MELRSSPVYKVKFVTQAVLRSLVLISPREAENKACLAHENFKLDCTVIIGLSGIILTITVLTTF